MVVAFGPDGRYYVGLRTARTLMAFSVALDGAGAYALPARVVPFPRGFGFGRDGRLFLASGIGPTGEGDNRVLVFAADERVVASPLVTDSDLSPLTTSCGRAERQSRLLSSEQPFGAPDAATTVREYDATDGHLVRVFSPGGAAAFHKPRGLRFGPDGTLYCVAHDEVVAFDFGTGECLGATVRWPRLNGQALAFFP